MPHLHVFFIPCTKLPLQNSIDPDSSSPMAFKISACFLLLCSTLLMTVQASQPNTKETRPPKGINVASVSNLLSDKGYHAMALTLEVMLESLLSTQFIKHNTTQLTLFCPQDGAFLSSKFPQPPLTLLQYHTVPFKLNPATLEASFPVDSKVDTLLPGHPLVVTSLPGSGYTSLNLVKVKEWDLYNNGRVIIHGVEDFFDPAFQTLRYQQYDGISVKEGSNSNKENREIDPGYSSVNEATENWFILLCLVAAGIFVLIICFVYVAKIWDHDKDIEYSLLS